MHTQSSSGSFNQTLQFITTIKLQELEKQRQAYQSQAKVLSESAALGDDSIARLELLHKAISAWAGPGAIKNDAAIGSKLILKNLSHWLDQAKDDPTFAPGRLNKWVDTLETFIRHSSLRFDCAKLFGTLFNEWLSSGDSSTTDNIALDKPDTPAGDGTDAGYDLIEGRAEKFEQKERLESIIFEEKSVNADALTKYLETLFDHDEGKRALESVRSQVKAYGQTLKGQSLSNYDVICAIDGLLLTDLLSEDKRATLREFRENSTVLNEVASVLNMRLASLDTWSWPSEGIPVELRRHLNGKYRAFTDPDVIDAIMLHHLGVAWQVKLKAILSQFSQSKAWKTQSQRIPSQEAEDRKLQLRGDDGKGGIAAQRQTLRNDTFFLSQFATTAETETVYDENDNGGTNDNPSSPVAIKQKLLHILTTEAELNRSLYNNHVILRSDLEWFGPSLSHQAILTVFEFFGFPKLWLTFFQTFLHTPLRFIDESPDQIRLRRCGTPIGYSLSVVCGEMILFVMDYAVNQKADGIFLHRMHDDLWLWDAQPEKVAAAWKEMDTYAKLAGLKFNQSKTGSACVGSAGHPALPSGPIQWGFLTFDPTSARFIIDQKNVDEHIVELRRQLAATKSVFGWVNAYNKYMAFFMRNFGGRPAVCFGPAHTQDLISTIAKIQRQLFPSTQGGPVGHLRSVIEERFGMGGLPEGYFYFPIENGGLELRNPMVELFALPKHTAKLAGGFADLLKKEVQTYNDLKAAWDLDPKKSKKSRESPNAFMSFEEYTSLRDGWLRQWGDRYTALLAISNPIEMQITPAMQAALGSGKWDSMTWYDKWVTLLYGEELLDMFGALDIVDPNLIPVGMVKLFRNSRMRLDQ